jgi:patatin-related protein
MAIAPSSQEPGEAQEVLPDETEPSDRQEIRLALVMNGGVSLAIWMGGVTVEINRLINRDPVYADVLELMNSKVRVDVIAGASAGGINGALLAAMISHDNDRETELSTIRGIWLRDGAMGSLFRPPLEKDIPSLMKGDAFFLPRLQEVFDVLTNGPVTDPGTFPIKLTLTTTLLKAVNRGFADDFGSLISDADHRGEFTFRRGQDLRDDFDRGDDSSVPDRLALASRSTASFPAAFEPSYVPVNITDAELQRDRRRPDMKDHVNFSSSRFCADGGALVNKPFRPAIRGIFAQPAGDDRVRRVLAYVVPDPEELDPDSPQARDEEQSLVKVVVASAVTLPRAESVSRELEEIAEHNRRVRAQRLLRERLLAPASDGVDVERMAVRLFPAFQELRAQRIVDRLTTAADPIRRPSEGEERAPWDTSELLRVLLADPEPWLPSSLGAQSIGTPWTWGNDTIETMGAIALHVVTTGFRVAEGEARASLGATRERLHERMRELRMSCLRPEARFWPAQFDLMEGHWPPGGAATGTWRRQSFEDWRGQASDRSWKDQGYLGPDPEEIARGIAGLLAGAAPTLRDVAIRAGAGDLAGMVEGLSPADEEDPIAHALRVLLAQAIVQAVTAAGKPELDQPVQLLQISSTAPNGFDGRVTGQSKVAGRQLGHFGAFYKRSWRANDWMWGRLDGAARLAQMIVDPERLAQMDLPVEETFERLKAIALGPENSVARELLSDGSSRGWVEEDARAELAYLEDGTPPPKSLPACARAVARRLQLRILQEELPEVADAIDFDESDGVNTSVQARDFRRAVANASPDPTDDDVRIGPRDAARLLGLCKLGEEEIKDEAGSDLFTSTVTTAAALGVSTLAGTRSGLPAIVRATLGALRTPALTLWFLAKNATSGTRTGFAILILLLAVGGGLIALSALGSVALPGLLGVAGTVILVAGAVIGLLRLQVRGFLVILLAVTIVAVFLWLPSVAVKELIEPDATGAASAVRRLVPPIAAVIGFVVGGMILGMVGTRAPKDERGSPGRVGASPTSTTGSSDPGGTGR